jgi:hypothetical protein
MVVEAKDLKCRIVVPGVPTHGFLVNTFCLEDGFVIVALETNDDLVDFSKLFIDNFDDDTA